MAGLVVLTLLTTASTSSALGEAAPVGSGKTVVFSFTRSGTAGVNAGACGQRIQCFRAAVTEAAAATASVVENAALVQNNVAEPDQDVNMKLSGKQLLIAPDADPNLSGKADYAEAVSKISLGGGTCYTCTLQAAKRSFDAGARADSDKVIIMVAERTNTFASTGFTSSGSPTGYPPMTLEQMAGQFDSRTVIRAFAVGPDVTCSADPLDHGSLNEAAAVTPGGTCTPVSSFEGLAAILIEAVMGGGAPPPPPPPPPPGPTGPYADEVRADTPLGYWRLGELSGTALLEDQARANGTYSGGVVLGVAPAINDTNRAARFDGGNDKGSVPDNASLDFGTEDFTVEAWIKTLDSGERAIVAKRSLTVSEPYWALTVTDDSHHNGQIRAAYFDGTNTRQAYSSSGVLDGAWHHIVAWYDRDAGITISVDGVTTFTALAIGPNVSNTGTVEIGKAPTHNYFKGDLDEVALYGGLVPVERMAAHRAAAS